MASPTARILASTHARHRLSMLRPPPATTTSLSLVASYGRPTSRTALSNYQLQLQQHRSYVYLPTSWLEAKERFERWTESAKHTIVNVQLISKHKTLQHRRRFQKAILWNRNHHRKTLKSYRGAAKQQGDKLVSNIRRRMRMHNSSLNQSQWNAWILSQRTKLQDTLRQKNIPSIRLMMRPPSLPLPSTRTRTASFKERYQSFKLRRQEQYQRFKSKRHEEYVQSRERSKAWWIRTKQVLVDEYSRPEWFDELGRPLVAKDNTGRFVNPWKSQSTNGIQSLATIFHWRVERMIRTWNQLGLFQALIPRLSWFDSGNGTTRVRSKLPPPPLPALPEPRTVDDDNDSTATATELQQPEQPNNNNNLQLTWIGHSTCWIQMKDLTILTDPHFSLRAGPYQWLPIGVPREIPPSHSIPELANHCHGNKIDLCCISHDHYDHMDKDSIIELKDHVQLWVVPLGIKEWLMQDAGIQDESKIVELEWWQQVHIEKNVQDNTVIPHFTTNPQDLLLSNNDSNSTFTTITCCPASHWGSRTMTDRNFRLWCSFAFTSLEKDATTSSTTTTASSQTPSPPLSFFFCGDTGYPDKFPLFRQIGDALGPFDLAAIPIGAYKPSEMMKDAHVNPVEALQIHNDLRSKQSIGIHWGTFSLSEEDLQDPPKDLEEAIRAAAAAVSDKDGTTPPTAEPLFTTLDHGETIEVSVASSSDTTSASSTMNPAEAADKHESGDDEEDEESASVASM